MTRLALAALILAACSKHEAEPAAKPTTASAFHLTLGDAIVYELVDRRWNKREPPIRHMVLHADGTAEMINDKTDKPWLTFSIKADGSASMAGKQVATIGEHAIQGAPQDKPIAVDGNTLSLEVNDKIVKVVLADDGNITVVDRPDGNKWRIDAKDPAVRRTAFLVLALTMKVALD